MNQTAIFGPLFAMIGLTLLVWIYMYVRRLSFFHREGIDPNRITPLEFFKRAPVAVSNPSDNLRNLFELPVLFYVLVLYLFVTQQVDQAYLVAAWLFVGFRSLHSAVHCTFNHVMTRFGLYIIASIAVWFIAARAAGSYLQWW